MRRLLLMVVSVPLVPLFGQYYPGMGVGIPMPNIHLPQRKPKDTAGKITVVSLDGTLRSISEVDVVVHTKSDKMLRFLVTPSTEFRGKDGGKPHPGDRVTIDTLPNDPATAVHVILVRAANSSERAAAEAHVDEARISTPDADDFGRPHSVAGSADAARSVSDLGSNSDSGRPTLHRADSDASASDDGRPTLHRADSDANSSADDGRRTLHREDTPGPASTPHDSTAKAPAGDSPASSDSVIDDARDAARSFSSDLPNFLVQQVTTRYQGSRYVDNWRSMDVVTADVASVDGKEDYRNIKVNGRPTTRPEDSGSWSTGEFQVTLQDILSPMTAATFKPDGEDRIANRAALVYRLSVEQPHSHWTLVAENGRQYKPAYKGTIWIDKETRRVLRVEQQAVLLPRDFAYDKAESMVEYGYVSIEGTRYLLPLQSVNMACNTGTSGCSRNVIEFRNYRKFSADSNITFDK
ncbi:MAG: hypothetical protein ABSB15_23355 [Bryobacteraceae bacterium]|jgi:hypothetical protein